MNAVTVFTTDGKFVRIDNVVTVKVDDKDILHVDTRTRRYRFVSRNVQYWTEADRF